MGLPVATQAGKVSGPMSVVLMPFRVCVSVAAKALALVITQGAKTLVAVFAKAVQAGAKEVADKRVPTRGGPAKQAPSKGAPTKGAIAKGAIAQGPLAKEGWVARVVVAILLLFAAVCETGLHSLPAQLVLVAVALDFGKFLAILSGLPSRRGPWPLSAQDKSPLL